MREALLRHEESQRLHRMCRELKGKAALAGVLKKSHSQALEAYTSAEEEDDFRELLDPPDILGTSICCVCVRACIVVVVVVIIISQRSAQKRTCTCMNNTHYHCEISDI